MLFRPSLICLALIALVPRALPAVTINYSTVIGPGSELDGKAILVHDGAEGPVHVVIQPGVELESLSISGQSSVVMLGGDVLSSVNVGGSASFTLSDGAIAGVSANGFVSLTILGGDVSGSVYIGSSRGSPGTPQATIAGGTFLQDVAAYTGTMRIIGGDFQQIRPDGDGVVEITGGTMTRINASRDSIVHLSGGEITGDFDITAPGGTIHIYGSNLVHDRRALRLDGILADGTVIDNYYVSPTLARIVLHNVPEPSTFALASTAAISFALYWRRRSRMTASTA